MGDENKDEQTVKSSEDSLTKIATTTGQVFDLSTLPEKERTELQVLYAKSVLDIE